MARKAEYLCEENQLLKEALRAATGKSRIPLTDEQRRRLATKGKALTPAEREECCQIVRPSTILAWFRKLVARKYDRSQVRRPGRSRKANDIRKLVLRIAGENPGWGYTKIRDALVLARSVIHARSGCHPVVMVQPADHWLRNDPTQIRTGCSH